MILEVLINLVMSMGTHVSSHSIVSSMGGLLCGLVSHLSMCCCRVASTVMVGVGMGICMMSIIGMRIVYMSGRSGRDMRGRWTGVRGCVRVCVVVDIGMT